LYASGPVAFYFVNQTSEEMAEAAAQVFLGVRMQCARCHHHPFEVWSQDDYHGLAAFFAGVERKDTREGGRYGGAQSIKTAAAATLRHPQTGEPVRPALFGASSPLAEGQADVRQALARFVTDRENPFFARNIVNRYWSYLMGRGLVEPVDDLRASNPASHPELFDDLSRDFVEHGFDLKHLLRTICNSRTYQLACEIAPARDEAGMFFTHRSPRRLSAETLLDAINQAAGTLESFEGFPAGTRAIALPDPAVASYFLETFGRPLRVSACECERPMRADLRQVLHLANGEGIHSKIAASGGRVARLLAENQADASIVEELYLATLSRWPAPDESALALELVAAAPSRKEGFEDLLWALLNMTEFSSNH
jgi:Protein of unknown function (DUF1553)/Protein of unknown function (DUF1549)